MLLRKSVAGMAALTAAARPAIAKRTLLKTCSSKFGYWNTSQSPFAFQPKAAKSPLEKSELMIVCELHKVGAKPAAMNDAATIAIDAGRNATSVVLWVFAGPETAAIVQRPLRTDAAAASRRGFFTRRMTGRLDWPPSAVVVR